MGYLRRSRSAGCGTRQVAPALIAIFTFPAIILSSAPGAAQDPPKIENPPSIPSTVRPGVIETQYNVELKTNLSDAPAVLSPYEPEQPENADRIFFTLREIAVDGGRVLPAAEIEGVYRDKIGQEINLTAVFDIARKITRLYADAGYPLSLAYVPIQEIKDGVVRIRILEGFIGEIDVIGAPESASRRLKSIGEKLKAERPLTQRSLERYLLVANQIPGYDVTGVLERADRPDGGVKMTLKATPKRFSLAVGSNNRASAAVGREQVYARVGLNTLLTGADQFGFAAVQSVDLDELTYFSASYATAVNAEGLTFGLTATRSEAAPGIPFLRDLGFETMGWTAAATLSYPLVLRRDKSLTVSAHAAWKEFKSAFGVSPNTEDTLWTTQFGAVYAHSDRFEGKNIIGLSLTRGWDVFGATQAGDPLASRAGGGGEFVALTADVSRNQTITEWLNAVVAIKAQTANNPLLSSEQCGYGGAGFGRGFDPYVISGDRCIVGLAELQAKPAFLDFGAVAVRPYVAVDAGAVRQIGTLAAGEDRTSSLYSFSAGARMTITKHISAAFEGAVPLKDRAPGSNDDARFYFSLEARY